MAAGESRYTWSDRRHPGRHGGRPAADMSVNLHDNLERTFIEQLARFDEQLKEQDDNAALLTEIHAVITELIADNGGRDEEIRATLQRRDNAGKLSLPTYPPVRHAIDP